MGDPPDQGSRNRPRAAGGQRPRFQPAHRDEVATRGRQVRLPEQLLGDDEHRRALVPRLDQLESRRLRRRPGVRGNLQGLPHRPHVYQSGWPQLRKSSLVLAGGAPVHQGGGILRYSPVPAGRPRSPHRRTDTVRARGHAREGARGHRYPHAGGQGHRGQGSGLRRRHPERRRSGEQERAARPQAGDRAGRADQAARGQERRHRDCRGCRGHHPAGGPRRLLSAASRPGRGGRAPRSRSADRRPRSTSGRPISSSAAAPRRLTRARSSSKGGSAPGDALLAGRSGALRQRDGGPGRARLGGQERAPRGRLPQRGRGRASGARHDLGGREPAHQASRGPEHRGHHGHGCRRRHPAGGADRLLREGRAADRVVPVPRRPLPRDGGIERGGGAGDLEQGRGQGHGGPQRHPGPPAERQGAAALHRGQRARHLPRRRQCHRGDGHGARRHHQARAAHRHLRQAQGGRRVSPAARRAARHAEERPLGGGDRRRALPEHGHSLPQVQRLRRRLALPGLDRTGRLQEGARASPDGQEREAADPAQHQVGARHLPRALGEEGRHGGDLLRGSRRSRGGPAGRRARRAGQVPDPRRRRPGRSVLDGAAHGRDADHLQPGGGRAHGRLP